MGHNPNIEVLGLKKLQLVRNSRYCDVQVENATFRKNPKIGGFLFEIPHTGQKFRSFFLFSSGWNCIVILNLY